MPRFYVYALIDPRTRCPRYIGKGLSFRTEAHLRQAGAMPEDALVVGAETDDVLAQDQDTTPEGAANKVAWLQELLDLGYSHADIARVIARDLDEPAAFTLESFLIHHVYGMPRLLNLQAGHHAERFRPKGVWDVCNDGANAAEHDWCVYVLRDPNGGMDDPDAVFYVGKGSGSRLDIHFLDAGRIQGESEDPAHLRQVRRLLDAGVSRNQIGHVVARVATEQEAFLIEALLIKFVYGLNRLTNQVAGHHAWAIRPKDHWGVLPGFDLARVIDPGMRQDRSELLELLLAEGLGNALDRIRQPLEDALQFGSYKVLDAGELGMETPLGGTLLKVFTRRKKIQLELRPRTSNQRAWMRHRFGALVAEHLLRGDAVFIPLHWRGANGMTDSVEEAVIRARLLIELTGSLPRESLSVEALSLLDPAEFLMVKKHLSTATRLTANAASEPVPTLNPDGSGSSATILQTQAIAAPSDHDCGINLQAIAGQFPDVDFDLPRPRDASEIGIEGLVGAEGTSPGATLKVSCRKNGYGLELRGRTRERREWLHERLSELGCTLPRAMNPDEVVFLPTNWKRTGIAKTVEVAAHRVALLVQIIGTINPDDLDEEARGLLYE